MRVNFLQPLKGNKEGVGYLVYYLNNLSLLKLMHKYMSAVVSAQYVLCHVIYIPIIKE